MDCSCVFKKLGSLNAHISKMHISVIEVPSGSTVRKAVKLMSVSQVMLPQRKGFCGINLTSVDLFIPCFEI